MKARNNRASTVLHFDCLTNSIVFSGVRKDNIAIPKNVTLILLCFCLVCNEWKIINHWVYNAPENSQDISIMNITNGSFV